MGYWRFAIPWYAASEWAFGSMTVLMSYAVVQNPYEFLKEKYFTPYNKRSPFVQRATPFQDFVIRCVRYAFANMPACIGRVFFSKAVSLPFLRFRMLRHGYLKSPIPWHEVKRVSMCTWASVLKC